MRFALAPMSTVFVVITTLVFALGGVFLVLGAMHLAPLLGGAALVFAICAATWLTMRPTGFDVGPEGLVTVFPTWRQVVPAASIASARVIDGKALRTELGMAMRIGAGGLFGTFGWLWTTKHGMVTCWISRTDGLLWIERRGAGPLLITPERPAELLARLPRG